ncbi:MAG: DUF4296 domain-containing protein [Chitinophagaceae bacterium]
MPSISLDKMKNIMSEMHIADAYAKTLITNNIIDNSNEKDSIAVYYAKILAHYAITEDELKKNIQWYAKQPKLMDSLYTAMLSRVSTLYPAASKDKKSEPVEQKPNP